MSPLPSSSVGSPATVATRRARVDVRPRAAIRISTALLAVATACSAAEDDPDYHRDVRPFLERHCVACHGPDKQKSGLRLDTLGHDLVADVDAAFMWEEARHLLAAGEMPPEDEPRPERADVARVLAWIDLELRRSADAAHGRSVVMRRLNRLEYANTLRDLLGVVPEEVDRLPPDVVEEGFDNIGSALRVSPLHMEQYLAVARSALDRVLTARPERPAEELWRWETVPGPADPDDPWATGRARKHARQWADTHARLLEEGPLPKGADEKRRKQREKDLRRRPGSHDRLIGLRTAAEDLESRHPRLEMEISRAHGAWAATDATTKTDISGQPELTLGFGRFRIAEAGTYRVRMRVASSGQPLGWRFGPPVLVVQDWPRVVPLYETPVTADTDAPEIHAFTVDLEPGEFGLRINHKPYPAEAELGKRDPRPRILVDWIEVEGPVFPFRGWPSPAQRRFVGAVPADAGTDWARARIRDFARAAWRAPVAERDLERLVALYETNRGEGVAPVPALKEAFAAVLCSPRFLYLVEPAPGDGDPRPLTSHEVASRLSYFLWRSMPDEELAALAESDRLRTADQVAAAATRMLADPRSSAFVHDFTDQWLDLRHLAEAFSADAAIYPDWDEALRASMIAESRAFVAELFATDASLLACLDSDFTMLDRRLAHHYGIPGVYGDHVRRVALRDGDHRGGVLTHGSVLTLTSNGTRTSPVHRGVFVLERILGTPPPPPPPNAGEIANKVPGTDKVTVRERLALHRQVEECAGCHRKIDPLGLALEQYNGIGRWRTHEFSGSYVAPTNLGSPIDASARMPDGHAFDGAEELKATLLGRERERFLTCFAEKMLTYALGRRLTLADGELVDAIAARLAEEDARPSVLIDAIVRSEAFRSK